MAGMQQNVALSGVTHNWQLPAATTNATNPLITLIAHYPILEGFISHLHPQDAVHLSLLSQATHSHLRMHDPGAKANLLTRTLCPSLGLAVRKATHCPCSAKTFSASIGCGGLGFKVESRPCIDCGINTCDECRIHVHYQVLMEDPGLDKHRWWAGYQFLQRRAVAVYPPKNGENAAWYLAADKMMPLHDQGRFHTALDAHAVADPEPIDRILDIDLGRHQITPNGRTEFPYCNHEMVAYLRSVASCRKELVCSSCFKNHQEEPLRTCSCTLRKRFLDQWICVPCYKMHYESDANVGKCMNHNYNRTGANSCKCRCGATLDEYTEYDAICNWCEGWIGDAVDDNNSDEENDTPEPIEEEQDEDHSAADFEDVAEDTFGFAVNRDGTVSAYTNGTSFRGERLGRGLVLEWMFKRGEDIPCSCCLCEVGEESISEESHTVGEEESDMDSADGEDESDMDSAHGEDMSDSHTASDDEDSGL